MLLQSAGLHVKHKKVLRIYSEEYLNLRSKRPRRSVAAAHEWKAQTAQPSINAGAWALWRIICLTVSK